MGCQSRNWNCMRWRLHMHRRRWCLPCSEKVLQMHRWNGRRNLVRHHLRDRRRGRLQRLQHWLHSQGPSLRSSTNNTTNTSTTSEKGNRPILSEDSECDYSCSMIKIAASGGPCYPDPCPGGDPVFVEAYWTHNEDSKCQIGA